MLKHNTTDENGLAFLVVYFIGRLNPGVNKDKSHPVAPIMEGQLHGSEHLDTPTRWRVQSAYHGDEVVPIASPLNSVPRPQHAPEPTLVFSVDFLWNRPGTAVLQGRVIQDKHQA